MSAKMISQILLDEQIPLCFDTCAIYGENTALKFLESVRKRFPQRRLLIPTWVVAERVRQLKVEHGENFRLSLVMGFLKKPDLKLELSPFDESVALNGWLDVVGRFQDSEWDWKGRKTLDSQPCAERCRVGDHIIYAVARAHKALLVTEDDGLLKQVGANGIAPGAVHARELKRVLSWS